MTDSLVLKWGTLKGWDLESEAARIAMRAYHEAGPISMSAMAQRDNPAQQDALCALIDAIDGEIYNDWTGENLSKEEAKKYVREYRK